MLTYSGAMNLRTRSPILFAESTRMVPASCKDTLLMCVAAAMWSKTTPFNAWPADSWLLPTSTMHLRFSLGYGIRTLPR